MWNHIWNEPLREVIYHNKWSGKSEVDGSWWILLDTLYKILRYYVCYVVEFPHSLRPNVLGATLVKGCPRGFFFISRYIAAVKEICGVFPVVLSMPELSEVTRGHKYR